MLPLILPWQRFPWVAAEKPSWPKLSGIARICRLDEVNTLQGEREGERGRERERERCRLYAMQHIFLLRAFHKGLFLTLLTGLKQLRSRVWEASLNGAAQIQGEGSTLSDLIKGKLGKHLKRTWQKVVGERRPLVCRWDWGLYFPGSFRECFVVHIQCKPNRWFWQNR